ncbi:MAG: hypothetical protein WCJ17_02005 [bacterium]
MKKTIKNLVLIASVFSGWLSATAPFESNQEKQSAFKAGLVETLRRADLQREWLNALCENKEVDLKELSLDQLNETLSKLTMYQERLRAQEQKQGALSTQERQCLELNQELARQLTNARLAYESKVNTTREVKKIAISAGAAVAVFGGLMLLNVLTPLDISWNTALLCGVATGCVVGVITHYDSLLQQVRSVSSLVEESSFSNSMHLGVKTLAAIGAVAALSGIAWWQKDAIMESLHLKKPQCSLAVMAKNAGLVGNEGR